MRSSLFTFIIVLLIFGFNMDTLSAQSGNPLAALQAKQGTSTLKGKVFDATFQQPVGFASVSLINQSSNAVINGTITDDSGSWEIRNLAEGTYKIEIAFLGYETITRPDIVLGDGAVLDLGETSLVENSQLLEEVVVKAEKSLIEERVDRLVFNASQDKLSQGSDAADLLRKVPMLQVDLEGNVTLRGSSNIRVLINNKPSTIIAANVSDALKMLPADMIDKVEVITSPSAKYDAEGSGGIINIITKKNDLAGEYLNVNTGVGLRGSNLGLNGSLRRGRFGLTLGGFGRAFYNKAEVDMTQITTLEEATYMTHQFSDASDNGIFGRYNLGFDFDIDKSQFISGGIRYGIRNFSRDELRETNQFLNDNLFDNRFTDISSNRYSGSWDLNLDYLKSFNPQHELSISTLYSITDENSNFVSAFLGDNQDVESQLKNLDDNKNREFTLQADYMRPIGENQIWEVGAKGIFRMVNSDYSYLSAQGNGEFSLDPNRPAGTLDYDQDVSAAYTTYTLSFLNDYTIKAGVRWEQTSINALQDEAIIDIPDYSNVVPSINLSKKLSMATTLKLGYNQRIQRPWLRQLNPNVNLQNEQEIEVGNPNLRPELTNNLELGLSTMIGKTFLNMSVYGRSTDNAINRVRYALPENNGAILSTYDNIGREKSIGVNVFANINISDRLTLNGGFDAGYLSLEGQVSGQNGETITATNDGFNIGGRFMGQYKLDDQWTVQAFSFMRGGRVELQGSRGGFGFYAVGVNKEFSNKRGSLGLSVENFASSGWKVSSNLETENFNQMSTMNLFNRSIRVNFSYKFGSMDQNRMRKKTKSVSNDDLMGGGENMNGGGNEAPATNNRSNRSSRPAPKQSSKEKQKEDKD